MLTDVYQLMKMVFWLISFSYDSKSSQEWIFYSVYLRIVLGYIIILSSYTFLTTLLTMNVMVPEGILDPLQHATIIHTIGMVTGADLRSALGKGNASNSFAGHTVRDFSIIFISFNQRIYCIAPSQKFLSCYLILTYLGRLFTNGGHSLSK